MMNNDNNKPTIDICMFCHKALDPSHADKEIDTEACVYNISSQEPCDRCKEEMSTDDITLLGFKRTPVFGSQQEPIQISEDGSKSYLTGTFLVMPPEAVRGILDIDVKAGDGYILVGEEFIDVIVKQYKLARDEVFGEQ